MYVSYDKYGVLLLLGQEYQIWSLEGTALTLISKVSKKLPNNHSRGGFSQNRMERLRQEAIDVYLNSINEKLEKVFIDSEYQIMIQGLLIVGTGEKKVQIKSHLNPKFQKIILGVLTGTEIKLNSCLELINKELVHKNKKEWQVVSTLLQTNPDQLSFGRDLEKDLKNYLIKTLFVSAELSERVKNIKINQVIIPLYDPIYSTLESYGGYVGIKWN